MERCNLERKKSLPVHSFVYNSSPNLSRYKCAYFYWLVNCFHNVVSKDSCKIEGPKSFFHRTEKKLCLRNFLNLNSGTRQELQLIDEAVDDLNYDSVRLRRETENDLESSTLLNLIKNLPLFDKTKKGHFWKNERRLQRIWFERRRILRWNIWSWTYEVSIRRSGSKDSTRNKWKGILAFPLLFQSTSIKRFYIYIVVDTTYFITVSTLFTR